MEYFCKHIMTTIHTVIRCYDESGKRFQYYGYDEEQEPLYCDRDFEQQLLEKASEKYPVIYSDIPYVYYGILRMKCMTYVAGPVNISEKNVMVEGKTLVTYMKEKHHMSGSFLIPQCKYENFCAELLLLFYAGTGIALSFERLNEYNFLTLDLVENMRKSEGDLMFVYQEHERKHNPYRREQRMLESIRKGDRERLIIAYDETFDGEYGWLAEDNLRSAKNLAIVASGLAARAAIEGGVPVEIAYSMSDNCIRQVDKAEKIGEVKALERQNHLDYVELVRRMKEDKDSKNPLVEDCKNMIFHRLHSTIKIRDLAQELGVTQEYLATLFKRTTGKTITEYILQNKINLSENMLIYSEYNVGQISTYLGFHSQSHFDRTFRKYNGISPVMYRNRYRYAKSESEN